MNMPDLRKFLGWEAPAIELVAEQLEALNKTNPSVFRRATVVVPTAESGRRLREYMAERAGKPLLMPRITLAGQLIPCKGENIASDTETLAAWLQVLGGAGEAPVAQYAPLIPRRPETHRERWAVGVAHKLMALRDKLEKEEVGIDRITGLLSKREELVQADLDKTADGQENTRKALQARKALLANEQVRWRILGELFTKVDAILRAAGKIPAQQVREQEVTAPTPGGKGPLLILACVPELSPQLERYLFNLHRNGICEVQVWVNAPGSEKNAFDAIGRPSEAEWADRNIDIPHAFEYTDAHGESVDESRSTIHLVNDTDALATETVRLAGGLNSDEVVMSTGDTEFTPAMIEALADTANGNAWLYNSPEGRSMRTTDAGQLLEQLADYCTAREDFFHENTQNGGMQELNAFTELLNNRALQQILQADIGVLANLQKHTEHLREVMMPAAVSSFCDRLNPATPLPAESSYREREFLSPDRRPEYHAFAVKVAEFASACCDKTKLAQQLQIITDNLPNIYKDGELSRGVKKLCDIIKEIANEEFIKQMPDALTVLEVLRHRVNDNAPALHPKDARPKTVGDILGWKELAYTRGKRVIIAAMHDGCIPEPVAEDEFLPDSLCKELGIRHEEFRTARDSFLLTALLHSRPAGEVHFIITRQKADGTVVAPSSLLLRCGNQLPQRARTLFAEAATAAAAPPMALCPIKQAKPGPENGGKIQAGMMESIRQLSAAKANPFLNPKKTYSPSLLSGFLQCPLSFWLNHLFGLDAGNVYDEDKSEPQSNEYGSIMHAVLEQVVTHIPTEERLRAAFPAAISKDELIAALEQYAIERAQEEWNKVYPAERLRHTQPLPMEVQLTAIEKSMHDFAVRHVNDLLEGWCNIACEMELTPTLRLSNGESAKFKMIADRIDFNSRTGRWRIIDYKTSSSDKKPLKTHFEELPEGEASPFHRFMNTPEYPFPVVTVEFKKGTKFYRWADVQLMLYTFGLRQMKACDLASHLPNESLANVMPDLFYYNIVSKTQRMQCYPLLEDGQMAGVTGKGNTRGSFNDKPEDLLAKAMTTVDSVIRMIRDGKCLFSAEALRLKNRPYSRLAPNIQDKNAPRFGAISQLCDPRSMFNLPALNI